jgi:hypothetical protein
MLPPAPRERKSDNGIDQQVEQQYVCGQFCGGHPDLFRKGRSLFDVRHGVRSSTENSSWHAGRLGRRNKIDEVEVTSWLVATAT